MIDVSAMSAPDRRACFDSLIAAGAPTAVAAVALGYTERTAQEYRRQDREKIKALAMDKLADGVPLAIQELLKLVSSAESEAVRLNAINRLLAANNLDTIQRVQLSTISDADLNERLLRACGGDQSKVQIILKALSNEG